MKASMREANRGKGKSGACRTWEIYRRATYPIVGWRDENGRHYCPDQKFIARPRENLSLYLAVAFDALTSCRSIYGMWLAIVNLGSALV